MRYRDWQQGWVSLAVSGVLILGLAGGVCAQPMTRVDKQKMYIEYLQQAGYRPKVDRDGDIQFMREGKNVYIIIDESDQRFFELMIPLGRIQTETFAPSVLSANYANAMVKVAKIYATDKGFYASYEAFLTRPDEFRYVFQRALKVLDEAINSFLETIDRFQSNSSP